MWVEERNVFDFTPGQKIAVLYDQTEEKVEGTFVRVQRQLNTGFMVYFIRDDGEQTPYSASHHRKFFRWEEDKPVTGEDVRRVEQSKLRTRWWDQGQIIAEQEQAPLLKARAVIVGKQTYVLNEGDHLRVWWEDGHLYTEYIQGVEQ